MIELIWQILTRVISIFHKKLKLQSDLFTVIPSVQIFGHKTIYLKYGADNIRLMY